MLGLPFSELRALYKRRKQEVLAMMSRKIEAFMGENVSIFELKNTSIGLKISSDIDAMLCFDRDIMCMVYCERDMIYSCLFTQKCVYLEEEVRGHASIPDGLQQILRNTIAQCLTFETHGERMIFGKPRILALQRYVTDLFDCYVRFPTCRNIIMILCAHKHLKGSLVAKIPRDVWVNLILKRYVLL